jgi:serine/threonine-protein kinase PpkA
MTQRVLHTLDMDSTIKIPGYRIESKIGEGGMATVYLASQEALERSVALKIMAPTTLADPSAEERFLKEGKIIAGLSHPNIVTVYTIGRYESIYYMVIEYIKGGNLIARIHQGLTVQNTFDICKQIASALGYAHKRGYIHRDVKPANILFREDGTAVLSDFGIAKAVVSRTHLTAMGQAIGTPEYMSPEQITGSPLDARCDLYSLGIVLYEMLTRQKPFKGDTALSTAMCHLRDPVPQLPKPLTYCQPLIERLLAKNPDERFATAEQFIQILEDISAKAARSAEPSRTKIKTPRSATDVKSIGKERPRPHKWLKSKPIAWAGGVGVLVIVVGSAVYYWQMAHYIDPRTRVIINMLLSQAEQQMATSRLIEPAGDNAYQKYQYILEFDPRNKQAREGLKNIADRLEKHALAKQQQDQFEEALALTAQGIKIAPQHEGLRALRKDLTQQLEEKWRRREVARLLAKAKHQLAASHLMAPTDDNAYQSYRSVLKLDPHNQQALAGMQEIGNHFEQLARAKQQQEQYKQGLKMVTQGLVAAPKHSGLLALQKELTQQLEKKRRQREVARLLAQADRQLKDSRLLDPPNDNAYASYRKVLELEPENAQAKVGLERIAGQFEQSARQRQAEGSLQESLTAIEQGLQVLPGHTGLQALRTEVQGQIDAQARQRAEQKRRQREVARLLAQADRQLKDSRLLEPTDDNAYASYRKVLELEPENAPAQTGLERIAEQFEQSARQRQAEGSFQESLAAIKQGLQVIPGHTGLQALRTEVQAQIDAQARQRAKQERRQREVARLLAQADRQLKASRLLEPPDDNAYASYRKVLELEPDNAQAKAGLGHIAGQFEQLARQRQAEGSFQESLTAIEHGLQVLPEHAGLQALRAQVQTQIDAQARQRAEQERRQREVAKLLAQAERQLKASQLIEPANDNAYASYRKVLKLEPDNAQAKAGLGHIAEQFEQSARQRQAEGSFQESLAAIKQGLQVIPGHTGLQALRAQVQAQIDAQTRQQAEQERRRREVAQLLTQAERQLADSKLLEPVGDNAYASYRKVLELDPDNGKARHGLETIPARIEDLAQSKRQQGRLDQSLSLVGKGLEAFPEHRGLQELRGVIAREQAQQKRQQELADLLAKATAQFADSKFIQPEEDNALATYQSILALDSRNEKARQGLQAIAEHFEKQARSNQKEGRLIAALVAINAGLKAVPDDSNLMKLQQAVKQNLNKKAQRQHQQRQSDQALERLLAEADQQLADLYLTTPKGNNAYESYQQALKISPHNPRALAGIQHIADRYYELGKANLDNGSFEDSLKLIDRGLQVAANHSALLDLKEEVQRKLEEENTRQQALQRLVIEAQQQYRTGDLRRALATISRGLNIEPTHSGLLKLQKEIEKLARKKRLENEKKRLLAKAQEKLETGQLMQPEGDNAYEIYQKVLELDPKNLQAQKGLQILAKDYETQARAKQQEGDLNGSLSLVEQGLKIDSRHPGLLKLQATLTHQLESAHEQKKRVIQPERRRHIFGNF